MYMHDILYCCVHQKGFLEPSSYEPFTHQSKHDLHNQFDIIIASLYILYIPHADIVIIISDCTETNKCRT